MERPRAPGGEDPLARVVAGLRVLLESGEVATKGQLQSAKQRLSREAGLQDLPTDSDVAHALGEGSTRRWGWMRTKPTRSLSGVAIVAVMSSPAACPHGKCTFCPGGPEVDAPQSYTGHEPSTLRARRHAYRSYDIVRDRLRQLQQNGHAIDKVEIVIQGGTFPAREAAYQDWFVSGIYLGLNHGPADDRPGSPPMGDATRHPIPARDADGFDDEGAWASMAPPERSARLGAAMLANESASSRCVGLTIETKPDWCFEAHVDQMLAYGATRVEVGLQALDDGVLLATHRGHTLDDSRRALRVARDAGLKVCVHMMPGLPRPKGPASPTKPSPGLPMAIGTGPLDPDPAADIEDMRRLFAEADWRPDMLKIYPTLIVQEGDTTLKRQWQRGEYHPYDSTAAARVVAAGKSFVPEWCRIQRIDRDIPTTHVEAGVMNSNLRQIAEALRRDQGLPPCRCIRCREVARRLPHGQVVRPDGLRLVRRDYEAGGNQETFLSLEDPDHDAIVGFLRLRRLRDGGHRPETPRGQASAIVRELKVYGVAKAVGDDDPEAGAWQHQGHGARLLREAETIAFQQWDAQRVLVIAGVGVKAYYRRHGYVDVGAYVGKTLADLPRPAST